MYAGGGIGYYEEVGTEDNFKVKTIFAAYAAESIVNNDNKCRKCGECSRNCPVGISVKEIVCARQKDAELRSVCNAEDYTLLEVDVHFLTVDSLDLDTIYQNCIRKR